MAHHSSTPGQALSFGQRSDHIDRLRTEVFDLLVVGGGITGAGVALDAASRGLSVGLVDKGDFANGTSSRSTKLIHGGLRYLAQLEFALTHEALTERAVLKDLAPDLVDWLPFVLPVYRSLFNMAQLYAGLWLYDLLAVMRTPSVHRCLGRAGLLKISPDLSTDGLIGGYVYSDCRTDDVRLTVEVLRTAIDRGAATANYVQVEGFPKERGKAIGLEVTDLRSGESFAVRGRKTILAGGVWVDRLLKMDDPGALPHVRPAKGVHLVVPKSRLDTDVALFLPTARDGRLVFVIPWQGVSLIGTTDTEYDGSLETPFATLQDVDYLLESVNVAFPKAKLERSDVVSVQAGLRPLISEKPGDTTKLSREDKLFETGSGLIAIAGGKLTTYRKMAERAVDLASRRLREEGVAIPKVVCQTDRIGLGAFAPGPQLELPDLTADLSQYLRRSYGVNAAAIAAIARERPELAERIVPGLPAIGAEVVYAVRHEMAQTVLDVLARRAHVVQLDRDQSRSAAVKVAGLIARELGWSEEQTAAEARRFEEDVKQFSPRDVPSA